MPPEELVSAFFPIAMGLIVLIIGFSIAMEFMGDFKQTREAIKKAVFKPERVDPVIAYKTAELFPHGKHLFAGVSGRVGYNAIDEATEHGFHMYDSIYDALQHPQGSNAVFMEVVGYGDVVKWSYGYTTSHQKVLQVILGKCTYRECGRQGERWLFRESGHLTAKPRWPEKAHIAVICRYHRLEDKGRDVRIPILGTFDVPSFKTYTRQDLEALLKEKAGYHIPVVGEREGYDLAAYKPSIIELDKIESIS